MIIAADKKGVLKASVLGFFVLVVLVGGLLIFSSFNSRALTFKDKYALGERIKIDLREYGTYELRVKTPTNMEKFYGKGNSVVFSPKEAGKYTVFVISGSRNDQFTFFVVAKEEPLKPINESQGNFSEDIPEIFSENESLTRQISVGEAGSWKRRIAFNKFLNKTLDLPPGSFNISVYVVSAQKAVPVSYKILNYSDSVFINVDENITWMFDRIEVTYLTPSAKQEERSLSPIKKEVRVSSPRGVSYSNLRIKSELPQKISQHDRVIIREKSSQSIIDSEIVDNDMDGAADSVSWDASVVNETTFEIIIISWAEHLDSGREFISTITDQVIKLDDVWSEPVSAGEYVRVSFERLLDSSRDITIFPRVLSGKPRIEVYERDGAKKIAEFSTLDSDSYNKVYLTNLNGVQDTFDLRVVGGTVKFDHIIDPQSTYLINTDASSTATATTAGSFSGGKNLIRLNSNRLIAYWEDGSNDASCSSSVNEGVTWAAYSSESGTHGDLALATNGSAILYLMTDESANDLDYIYRTTNTCDISSGAIADINANTNNNRRPDVAFNNATNEFVICSVGRTDSDLDYAYTNIGLTARQVVAGVGGARTIDSCSIDVNKTGGVFVAADDAASLVVFSSSNNFGAITTTTAYDSAVNDAHMSIRENEILISAVDTNADLVVINSSDGSSYTSRVLAGTFQEAEGCIDSEGKYHIVVTSSGNLYYIQYSNEIFSDLILLNDTANNLRWPSVRCSNYPVNNRMDDGRIEMIYTQLTANDVYFSNFTIPANAGVYGNPLVNITAPDNITYTSSSIQFNFTMNEPGFCLYSLNDGALNYSMSNFSLFDFNATNSSIADGTYFVDAYCNDSAGNWNMTESRQFKVDHTPPSVTINYPMNESYRTTGIGFNFSLDEAGSCIYSLNGGGRNYTMSANSSDTGFNATNSSIAEGIYFVNAYCNDTAGNWNRSERQQFRMDRTVPRINIVSPLNQNYTTSIIQFNVSVNEEASWCGFSLDGAANTTMSRFNDTYFNYINSTMTQGNHNVVFACNDTAGNMNFSSGVRSFAIDSITPLVNILRPLNQSYRTAGIDFNFSLNEAGNCVYSLNNGVVNYTMSANSSDTGFNATNSSIAEGIYFVNAYCNDTAGNWNRSERQQFKMDRTAPLMTIVSPLTDVYPPIVQFNVSVNEEASWCGFSLDGVANITMTRFNNTYFNYTNSTMTQGNHNVVFACNDTAGNMNSSSGARPFTVDSAVPLVNITSPLNRTYKAEVNFNFSLNEAGNCLYSLNNGATNYTMSANTSRTGFNATNSSILDGIYFVRAYCEDDAGNWNRTERRQFGVDKSAPRVSIISPQQLNYSSRSINLNVSLNEPGNCSYSLNNGIVNYTMTANSSWTGFNRTNSSMADGNYLVRFFCNDSIGNENNTESMEFRVDATFPLIAYGNGTEENGAEFERDWIYVNVSVNEANFANITFTLYDGEQFISGDVFTSPTFEINWTGLSDENHTFYYNVTVTDTSNNRNSTPTRSLKLVDITLPTLTLISPQNKTYDYNASLALTFIASDLHLQSCWYTLNGGSGIDLPGCAETQIDVPEGSNNLTVYVNDSAGNVNQGSVIFYANTSLFRPIPGMLVYAESATGVVNGGIPRYRMWSGLSFGSELNATNTLSRNITWMRVAASPVREEYILATINVSQNIKVQVNSSLDGNSCWHNGTVCNSTLELVRASTNILRQRVDVAYEQDTGDALVVYVNGTANARPKYRIWNGTGFSDQMDIPQNRLSGVISYVRLASKPHSDEIALIMTNTSAINSLIWNGSEWTCEPAAPLSNRVTPEVYQHADLDYEQESGDLFIAFTANGYTEINFTRKESGSCVYTTSTTTTLNFEPESVVVNPQYGSDRVMVEVHDNGANQMQAILWDGSAMVNATTSGTGVTAEVSPGIFIAPAFAGTSPYGVAAFGRANNRNISYYLYNSSAANWSGMPGTLNATGLPALSSQIMNIRGVSFVTQNRAMFIIQDDADDLWAKIYNGDTNRWSNADGGVALETNTPTAASPFQISQFTFRYDSAGPLISVLSPGGGYNQTNILFNLSLSEDGFSCWYSFDGGITNSSMSSPDSRIFSAAHEVGSDGDYSVDFYCEDFFHNWRTATKQFSVDTTKPLIEFGLGTEGNDSGVENNWIYVNVTVEETHESNITFSLSDKNGLVNETVMPAGTRTFNWVNLAFGNYSYNVTVYDLAGNSNSTKTNIIRLLPPRIVLTSPIDKSGDNDGALGFTYSVNTSMQITNCSLVLNGFINVSNDTLVGREISSFQVSGLDLIRHNWSINCSIGGADYSSETRVVDVILTTGFYGETTDFNLVNDTSNISNLVLDLPGVAKIVYTQPVNLSGGMNLNDLIVLSDNLITVDSETEPRLNVPANLFLYNLSYSIDPLVLKNDEVCNFPDCVINSYNSGNFSFNVTGFSSYRSGSRTQLLIWDDSDSQTVTQNQQNWFYASYTNRSSGSAINGSGKYCNFSEDSSGSWSAPVVMAFNGDSGLYEYNASFPDFGTFNMNVSCYDLAGKFENLSAVDSFDVSIPTTSYLVLRGTVSVNGNANVSLDRPIDSAKAFIIGNVRSTSNTGNAGQVIPQFINATTIRFDNYGGGVAEVEWEVITGPDIYVRRGARTYSAGALEFNETVSGRINASNSFLLVSNRLNSGAASRFGQGLWTAKILNSTTIQLRREQGANDAGQYAWRLVQWDGVTVQNGSFSSSSGRGFTNLPRAVNQSSAFLIFSTRVSSGTGLDDIHVGGQMNNTAVEFYRGASPTGTMYTEWFVINSSLFYTRRGIDNIVSATQRDATINPALINMSRAFRFSKQNSTGTGTNNANALVTSDISNTTNLELKKATGTAQTNGVAWQVMEILDLDPPEVNLEIPTDGFNFSNYVVPQFNFSVNDEVSIVNCSLFGDWSGSFIRNQTISGLELNKVFNFSRVNVSTDGYYHWNVECTDLYGNSGRNSTNFTFAAFLPAGKPILLNITQTSNDGRGNVTLFWNVSNHSYTYKIYSASSLNSTFTLLNETNLTNYTDRSFAGNNRKFYLVSAWNPTAENYSDGIFGAHVYRLYHTSGNSRNWIGMPTNAVYLGTANRTLREIRNATAFTMWNATMQKRVTCNLYSCPSAAYTCTETNCDFNFDLKNGNGYEVNINLSAPNNVNWSLVGFVYMNQSNVSLIKNSTSFGKNWVSLFSNTSLLAAKDLLQNISFADAVSRWNSVLQTSQGLVYSPFIPGQFLGTNFSLSIEEGYEVSVNRSLNWTRV